MDKVKCECGHVNPPGTIICESCGMVLREGMEGNLLDMRYEGTARRSQIRKRTIIDKIWMFFSSVKVAVVLIVITLIASAVGTLLPQADHLGLNLTAEQFYSENYGWFGRLYYRLGFHDLYSSIWYMSLIALIGVSLVICSLDRFIPLYKALREPKIFRHTGFLERQRLYATGEWDERFIKGLEVFKINLKKKRYRIYEQGGHLLAEKGRFSRWGPYVNHAGLILFLLSIMLRAVPGVYADERLWLKEGETKAIPGTDKRFYLKHHAFHIEFYDEEDGEVYQKAIEQRGQIVKNYQSDVTLYEAKQSLPGEEPELEKIGDYEIRVNEPLQFEGYSVYQISYQLNELEKMTFALEEKKSGNRFGEITIDLRNPKKVYELQDGYRIELLSYFPDFILRDGEPDTKSPNPENPAFAFKIITPDIPDGEMSFAGIGETVEPFGENRYKMTFLHAETVDYTGLAVKKDRAWPLMALGGFVFLAGLIQGSFWQHRRIWIKVEQGRFHMAAHTNKGWFGFKRELWGMLEKTGLPKPMDQAEEKFDGGNEQGGYTVG